MMSRTRQIFSKSSNFSDFSNFSVTLLSHLLARPDLQSAATGIRLPLYAHVWTCDFFQKKSPCRLSGWGLEATSSHGRQPSPTRHL